MEIKETNLHAAYNAADDSGKQMLRALFPDMKWIKNTKDNLPVTERIKTFEDACNELGEVHPFVLQYRFNYSDEGGWNNNKDTSDFEAYLKLRIICAALNEGWEPQFTEDELRWHPNLLFWTKEELADKSKERKQKMGIKPLNKYKTESRCYDYASPDYTPLSACTSVSSRLCFKSNELADYAGKQFADLWMDFYLIRK